MEIPEGGSAAYLPALASPMPAIAFSSGPVWPSMLNFSGAAQSWSFRSSLASLLPSLRFDCLASGLGSDGTGTGTEAVVSGSDLRIVTMNKKALTEADSL